MTGPSSSDLRRTWTAIITWLHTHMPKLRASLNAPAQDADLADLEATLGQSLPGDWHALYRLANGQASAAHGLFYGLQFLSLKEVASSLACWRDLSTDPDIYDSFEGLERVSPPDSIPNRYINLGWIPFADAGGQHLGIDLMPGPAGQVGQVVTFGVDVPHKVVVAPNLAAFLSWFLKQLQTGNTRIVAEDGGMWPGDQCATPAHRRFV